ncbi:MAG: RNA 2'-phosphotransferase, partial [Rhodospirillales bacterium]|nr:RNA 2'-phosphotransferase [Rhodospirillales bacterium]
MSYLLRHGAEKERIPMEASGFMLVDDVLAFCNHSASGDFYTALDVEECVAQCPKKRFALERRADGKQYIRANQGHSLMHVEVQMERVLDASRLPLVYHGTFLVSWPLIHAGGLSRM